MSRGLIVFDQLRHYFIFFAFQVLLGCMKNSKIDIAIIILLVVLIGILGVLAYQKNEVTRPHSLTLAEKLAGTFVINVEHDGEAWYIDPESFERIVVGTPNEFEVFLQSAGLTVSQEIFDLAQASSETQESLEGYIILNPSSDPRALYMYPGSHETYPITTASSLLEIIRTTGKGITNKDIEKISMSERE